MKNLLAVLLVGLVATVAFGAAEFKITEAYVGLSGEDGTEDWIEITNLGDAAGSLAGLFYDDSSLDISEGGDLPAVTLQPYASVVILIDVNAGDSATAISDFEAVWGTGISVYTTGGGALGQDGDTAAILDGSSTIIDSVDTPSALSGELATIDFVSDAALSVVGVNGAYASNPFFNDNLGLPNDEAILIGSPGVVPEPITLSLLGVGAVAALRRRG